jgi:hypothetical protein
MILLMLWAFVGVLLGYEAATHGIVQIVVPALFLLGMFLWAVVGLVLACRVSHRAPRRVPSAEEVRKAWAQMSEQHKERARQEKELE